MLRLQMALWVRLRYVRASFVKDSRPHGSCVVSRICLIVTGQLINSMRRISENPNVYLKPCLNEVKPYFDEEGQSVLFESKEAEDMMLSTLGKGHQVSKAINKYRFSF